jgi:hypothetical protein
MFGPIRVVTRPKKNGIGTHWGVEFPGGRVVDYIQQVGLRFTTREGFSDGLPITIVREVPWHLTWTVRTRLDEVVRNPRKYHLLEWNCETFAEWLTAGVPKSRQVAGVLLLLAVTAFLAIAAK